jgi:hypothetical protein
MARKASLAKERAGGDSASSVGYIDNVKQFHARGQQAPDRAMMLSS